MRSRSSATIPTSAEPTDRAAGAGAAWPAALSRRGVAWRTETPDDATFLQTLYRAERAAEVAAAGWPPTFATRFLDDQHGLQQRHYATHHPNADRRILTAAEADADPVPIGRLYLDKTGRDLRLLEIGLTDEWRRRGVGTAVIGWIQTCAAQGPRTVTLNVLRTNLRAASLYARLGFTEAASPTATHRAMRWSPSS